MSFSDCANMQLERYDGAMGSARQMLIMSSLAVSDCFGVMIAETAALRVAEAAAPLSGVPPAVVRIVDAAHLFRPIHAQAKSVLERQ